MLGYELEGIADMGAYSQNFTVAIPFLGLFVGSGQYKFPTFWEDGLRDDAHDDDRCVPRCGPARGRLLPRAHPRHVRT